MPGYGVGEIKVADFKAYEALRKWAKPRKVSVNGYCDEFQIDPNAYIPPLWCDHCNKSADHEEESCPVLNAPNKDMAQ